MPQAWRILYVKWRSVLWCVRIVIESYIAVVLISLFQHGVMKRIRIESFKDYQRKGSIMRAKRATGQAGNAKKIFRKRVPLRVR